MGRREENIISLRWGEFSLYSQNGFFFIRGIAAYTSEKFSCQPILQVRLVSILEDYKLSRRQKEEEKRRYKVNYLVPVNMLLSLRF